jgi:membrane-associated phospholipid phosphatase
MNRYKNFSFLLLLFLYNSNISFCQYKEVKPFNLDFTREAIILGAGTAVAATTYFILKNIQQLTSQEINMLNPADVNGFDRGAIGPYTEDTPGDVLLYASFLLPASFLAYSETRNDIWELTVMYAEVLLVQGSINGIVKESVLRTRPYVYDDETAIDEKTTTEARVSFYSGHTSICAAASFFTAKVFSEYLTDNTTKILIWSGAAILPAAMAVMRVNSHWHFPTDVMVGYAVGAFVGYIIPELHKNKIGEDVSIYPSIDINRPALSLQIKF